MMNMLLDHYIADREKLADLEKKCDRSEDDLKALQSIGQVDDDDDDDGDDGDDDDDDDGDDGDDDEFSRV
jgi:hypothetical protein